jgi:hypothetical protein
MKTAIPVVWVLHGETFVGPLELTSERLVVTSPRQTFACPFACVAHAQLERGPAERVRGLPAVRLALTSGDELRIASLAGPGSAQELASQIMVNVPSPGAQAAASGT